MLRFSLTRADGSLSLSLFRMSFGSKELVLRPSEASRIKRNMVDDPQRIGFPSCSLAQPCGSSEPFSEQQRTEEIRAVAVKSVGFRKRRMH